MRGARIEVITLTNTLQPLQDYFNSHVDSPRFLAVLSPVCGPCIQGARAVKASIVDALPDANISLGIVWIDMLPGDSEVTAKRSAQMISSPRASHFHDPSHLAGRAIASSLGWEDDVAWDVYLFYEEGAEWTEGPPRPYEWMHQLGGWYKADPDRFRTGEDLVRELHRTTQDLVGSPMGKPKEQ